MTAFLLEVTSNPAVEAKLLDEIQQVVGDGDVRWEDLHRLKYFSCCQKEALRLHPPAPTFVRIAKRAGLLGGKWAIDKGDLVAVPLIALHTNPKACAPKGMCRAACLALAPLAPLCGLHEAV